MATLTKSWQKVGEAYIGNFGGGSVYLRCYAKYSSQSIASNSTVVNVESRIYVTANSFSAYSGTVANAVVDGSTSGNISVNGTYSVGERTVASKSKTVTHNSDGTKNIAVSSYWASSPWGWSASKAVTVTLPKIARAATITSAPNFNDEENPTIKYSNPAGNSVSSLMACISLTGARDDIAYRNISKTGSSYTFNLTEEERNVLRNACTTANSRTVRFYVRTVIGGSTLNNYTTKTLSIVNANPIFSDFTFEDINSTTTALTGNNQKVVKGFSKVQATISTANKATGQKGATITKYRMSIGDSSIDITYSSTNNVTGTINNAENGTINIYAVDSRNNSTLVTKLASEEINYEPVYVNINNSSFQRDDNRVGDNGVLTLNGTFWNNSFGTTTNSLSVSYRFKKSDSSTWINGTTTITPTATNNDFTFSGMLASDNVDTTWDLESSYDLEITVTDELSSSITTYILASAIPTLSIDKDGVGVMCQYDTSLGGGLQVYGQPVSAKETNAILVALTDNPSYTAHANNATVKLTRVINQVGNKFTLSSNAVVVGAGISKVKVQLDLELRYTATTGKYYRVSLMKNGLSDASTELYIEIHKPLGEVYNVGSGTYIIDVAEGDKLTMKFLTNASGNVDINRNTGMYVEAIQ